MKADEFRDIRSELGFSQQKMAVFLDKSITAIRDWEKGRTKLDPLFADGIRFRVERYKKEVEVG